MLCNCFIISKAMKRCHSLFVFREMQFVSCGKLTYQQWFWISARIKCQVLDIKQMSHLQQQNSNHLYVLGVSCRTDGIQTSVDIQERKQENRMEHETTGTPEWIERHDLTEHNTFSRQMCRNRTVHLAARMFSSAFGRWAMGDGRRTPHNASSSVKRKANSNIKWQQVW
jgi:hypothetical protein